jgi:hypothetical protein
MLALTVTPEDTLKPKQLKKNISWIRKRPTALNQFLPADGLGDVKV